MFHSTVWPQQQTFKSQNNVKETERCRLWTESKKPWLVFTLDYLKSHFRASLIFKQLQGQCSNWAVMSRETMQPWGVYAWFWRTDYKSCYTPGDEHLKVSIIQASCLASVTFPMHVFVSCTIPVMGGACTPATLTLADTRTVSLFQPILWKQEDTMVSDVRNLPNATWDS